MDFHGTSFWIAEGIGASSSSSSSSPDTLQLDLTNECNILASQIHWIGLVGI